MTLKLTVSRRGLLRLGVAILLVAGVILGAQRVLHPAPPPGATLTDLTRVDQLQAMFNADKGSSRLVVILSPT
jgi:hypothetical protein